MTWTVVGTPQTPNWDYIQTEILTRDSSTILTRSGAPVICMARITYWVSENNNNASIWTQIAA